MTSERIIKDIHELKEIGERIKAQGKKIVFTNGAFDLLHVGHIRSLKEAKELGDILIVGINSDYSVKKLKGKGRPIIPQDERAEIVASLKMVDYVIIFDQSTVGEILTTLKPHIHAKGQDYTPETVPERDVVLSYGGKIAIVGGPKTYSTTDIIRAIHERSC